jgi:hypothetical protein
VSDMHLPISKNLALGFTKTSGEYPTGKIRKGLVLCYKNRDLSEEGVGFGVPVLKFADDVVFPGRGRIIKWKAENPAMIKLDYEMNLVERMARRGRRINCKTFYEVKEFLSRVHREYPRFRDTLKNGSITLRRAFGLETGFEDICSKRLIGVDYMINTETGLVNVRVDASRADTDACTEIITLNEQGANYFDRYSDSNGTSLYGHAIGTWDETTADEVSFIDSSNEITLTFSKVMGTRMYRGRELVRDRLAWAGLAYVVPQSMTNFAYSIRINIK